jgi:acetylornithine aminotransferase
LLAVELDVPAPDVAALLLESGVVVNAVTPTALRLAPSLLITDDEIDKGVRAIDAALAQVAATSGGAS